VQDFEGKTAVIYGINVFGHMMQEVGASDDN